MNEQRRKAGQIRIKRRGQRIARIGGSEIIARARTNVLAVEHGAASGVRADGFPGGSEVGPGRKQRRCSGKRSARGAKREHQRKREPTSRGVTGDDEALRRLAVRQKATIRRYGVVHRGWKGIFGSEAIVRGENAETAQCKPDRDGTVRLRGTAEVAAPVQIKQDGAVEFGDSTHSPGIPFMFAGVMRTEAGAL